MRSRKEENKLKDFFSNKRNIIIIASVLVLLIGGFITYKVLSKPGEDKPEEEEVVPTPTPTPTPTSNVKIIDIYSKTRPYAIMINSANEALPQVGLSKAYIVYELMVEYGVTRMMALYKDVELDKVGSVRSSRNQYLAYVYENDAIYVHAGGSRESLERISKENIDDIDVDGEYGKRDMELAKKRAWEHTLFTNTDLLSKAVKNKKLRSTTDVTSYLTYAEEELDLSKYETKKAKKVNIKYSTYRTSGYEYDSDKQVYKRFMSGKKHTDLNTGEQYTFKNIIVYGVKYTQYENRKNPNYQRAENIGTGEGYYITDGVALPITWEKKDEKSKTIYKIKETGEALTVNDGNTFIQVYPTNGGKLTIE